MLHNMNGIQLYISMRAGEMIRFGYYYGPDGIHYAQGYLIKRDQAFEPIRFFNWAVLDSDLNLLGYIRDAEIDEMVIKALQFFSEGIEAEVGYNYG